NGFEADARDGSLGSSAAKYLMDRLRPPHWFSAHLHCKFAAIVDYGPKVALGPPTELIFNGTNNAESTEKTNTEEIHVDLEDDLPVQAAHSHPLVVRNNDEIDLEMDDDVSQELPPIAALDANRTTSEPAATEVQVVSEDLRAQLPESFTRPQSTASTTTLPFPEAITNKVTRFLALDKCLPNRQFLQILDIEPISLITTSATSSSATTSTHRLCYDKEWLAITRAFATYPIIGDRSTPTLPNKGEAFYRPLIETEELWVEENLERTEKMMIPENFQITAPVYDASIGIGVREQPREYTNPQTVAFCEMLGIENVFCASEDEREERWRRGPRAEEPRMGRGGRARQKRKIGALSRVG
ncbi:hypothetical protein MMC12_007515, partial [Toensbergia leucococca]|nr:hypothetical protein [Toensbergia leucococca]